MTHLLCRNRVRSFEQWRQVFSSHAEAHRAAGLQLVNLWRSLEEPNNIFFLFEVSSLELAKAFINAPDAGDTAEASGVTEGEYTFLEERPAYFSEVT